MYLQLKADNRMMRKKLILQMSAFALLTKQHKSSQAAHYLFTMAWSALGLAVVYNSEKCLFFS